MVLERKLAKEMLSKSTETRIGKNLKRLRPFRRPLKRRRIIRFVTFQNECQLSYNLGLEGIEIFMVSTVFSGLLHHEDSWLRCFEIVPKSLYNLPKSFKNRLKIVVCGGALWRLERGLGASWGVVEHLRVS